MTKNSDGAVRVKSMKVSALTLLLFFIAVALVLASLVGHFSDVPYLTQYQYWLMAGSFGVLAFGVIFKGHS